MDARAGPRLQGLGWICRFLARRDRSRPQEAPRQEASVAIDPGCVKTLRGITAPGILGSTVMRRAKKRKNLSSARHYDQIRFRFHTTKTHLGHSPESITKRRGRRNCAPPATSLLAGRREQGVSLATGPQSDGKQCLSRAIASSPLERAIRRVPRPRDSRSM